MAVSRQALQSARRFFNSTEESFDDLLAALAHIVREEGLLQEKSATAESVAAALERAAGFSDL